MKKMFLSLILVGLEAKALANEDPAPLSSDPIEWLLPGLAYVLPGLLVMILLNEFAAKLPLIWRVLLAILFPLILWMHIFYVLHIDEVSYLQMWSRLPWIFSDGIIALFLLPSTLVIAAVGYFDDRRRQIARSSEVFSES